VRSLPRRSLQIDHSTVCSIYCSDDWRLCTTDHKSQRLISSVITASRIAWQSAQLFVQSLQRSLQRSSLERSPQLSQEQADWPFVVITDLINDVYRCNRFNNCSDRCGDQYCVFTVLHQIGLRHVVTSDQY